MMRAARMLSFTGVGVDGNKRLVFCLADARHVHVRLFSPPHFHNASNRAQGTKVSSGMRPVLSVSQVTERTPGMPSTYRGTVYILSMCVRYQVPWDRNATQCMSWQ